MSGNNKFFMLSRSHCKVPFVWDGPAKSNTKTQLEIKHDMGLAVTGKSDSFADSFFPFFCAGERNEMGERLKFVAKVCWGEILVIYNLMKSSGGGGKN
jgi:hypothetical protein